MDNMFIQSCDEKHYVKFFSLNKNEMLTDVSKPQEISSHDIEKVKIPKDCFAIRLYSKYILNVKCSIYANQDIEFQEKGHHAERDYVIASRMNALGYGYPYENSDVFFLKEGWINSDGYCKIPEAEKEKKLPF